MSITLILGVLPKDYNFEIKSAYKLALKNATEKNTAFKDKTEDYIATKNDCTISEWNNMVNGVISPDINFTNFIKTYADINNSEFFNYDFLSNEYIYVPSEAEKSGKLEISKDGTIYINDKKNNIINKYFNSYKIVMFASYIEEKSKGNLEDINWFYEYIEKHKSDNFNNIILKYISITKYLSREVMFILKYIKPLSIAFGMVFRHYVECVLSNTFSNYEKSERAKDFAKVVLSEENKLENTIYFEDGEYTLKEHQIEFLQLSSFFTEKEWKTLVALIALQELDNNYFNEFYTEILKAYRHVKQVIFFTK